LPKAVCRKPAVLWSVFAQPWRAGCGRADRSGLAVGADWCLCFAGHADRREWPTAGPAGVSGGGGRCGWVCCSRCWLRWAG